MATFTKLAVIALIGLASASMGCRNSAQLVPKTEATLLPKESVRIVVQHAGTLGEKQPLLVHDADLEIGLVGKNRSLQWDRKTGPMALGVTNKGKYGYRDGSPDVVRMFGGWVAGETYGFTVTNHARGSALATNLYQSSGPALQEIKVPIQILPVLDLSGSGHRFMASEYFPATFAGDAFKRRGYLQVNYGSAGINRTDLYQAVQAGQVDLAMLPKNPNVHHYLFFVLKQFQIREGILRGVEAEVEVYDIHAKTGLVVARGVGKTTLRPGVFESLERRALLDHYCPAARDSREAAAGSAALKAIESLPVMY